MTPHFSISIALAIILAAILRTIWKRWVVTITVPMNHFCVRSRHGKLVGTLSPGRYRFFGSGHRFDEFDARLRQLALQTQELTTREGIIVKVTAVGLDRMVDPVAAISTTSDFTSTLYTLIQLALRDAINGLDAEDLLAGVRSLGPKLLEVVRDKAVGLGLEVTELVVRDVILPADVKSALSETWRAKKSALAAVESARGKAAAARTMANAARLYIDNPAMLKLRYLEAIEQLARGAGNTFVIGINDEKGLKVP